MTVRCGAIAAGHKLTVEAAELTLREGGNAFDALISAVASACVVEPALAALGGGGFAIVRPAAGLPKVVDFFSHTPQHRCPENELHFHGIEVDFGAAVQEFHVGRGSCATPGMVAGLFSIHESLGSLPIKELFTPAIGFATKGVEMTPFQSYTINLLEAIYRSQPTALKSFSSPADSQTLIGEREILRQGELADSLEALAYEGADLFYKGEIGQRLVNDMNAGGHITLDDLADYEVDVREPIKVRHNSWHLFSNPPPSSGGTLIAFALKLLGIDERERAAVGTPEYLHRLVEVMRLTSQARLEAEIKGDGPLDRTLLDAEFIEVWRNKVAPFPKAYRGTTHISVIDEAGNQAAASLSNGEGSAYMIPGTGIMMNNMLGEEDLNPLGFHQWPTDTRLTSMMSPSLLLNEDGQSAALGSGGSNRIRTAMLQVITNLIDHGMDCEQAVRESRIHYENGVLSVEGGFDLERISPLLELHPDHQCFESRNLFFGGVHVVMSDGSGYRGAGDPRREGAFAVV